MEEEIENPLNQIFKKNLNGETIEEFEAIQKIPNFFKYLSNSEISQENKIYTIEELINKFNKNRYIIEFFSEYENNSIYIFITNLFILEDTTIELKSALINLISVIRNNIETGKEVYQYIFQKISKIYREEEDLNPDKMNNYLQILNAILGSNENMEKPRNYFSCAGNGQFIMDFIKQISFGNAFSLFLNFKIGIAETKKDNKDEDQNENENENENEIVIESEEKRISNLVYINFGNNSSISINLEYPSKLVIKNVNQDFKKKLPIKEYIFLFITFIPIPQYNSIKIILYSPDENGNITSNEFETFRQNPIKPSDTIVSLEFFKKFFGEVSSIAIFSKKEKVNNGILNPEFIEDISKFKGGLWKKKNVENFVKILKKYHSIESQEKKENKISALKKSMKNEEKKYQFLTI